MSQVMQKLRGGYRFRPFEGIPEGPVVDMSAPDRVTVPFAQGQAPATEILVQVDDSVTAGQVIARTPDAPTSPIHATISGRVTDLPVREGEKTPWAAVIEPKDASGTDSAASQAKAPADASDDAMRQTLLSAGLGSLLPDIFFNPPQESENAPPPETLLVSCVHTAPLSPKASVLFADREVHLVRGAQILKRLLNVEKLCFAVGFHDPVMEKALSAQGVENCVPIWEVYPREHPALLPAAADLDPLRTVCVTGRACLAADHAVATGAPMLSTLVAAGGSGLTQPVLVNATVGMSIQEMLAPYLKPNVEHRFIVGDFLTGRSVTPDTPIGRDCHTVTVVTEDRKRRLIAFMRPWVKEDSFSATLLSWLMPFRLKNDTNIHGEYRPCVNCGWCEKVCPAGLMPDMLMKLLRIDELEEAEQFRVLDCIECGLCGYVCPAKLPLLEELVQGKETVRQELVHETGGEG